MLFLENLIIKVELNFEIFQKLKIKEIYNFKISKINFHTYHALVGL